MTKNRTMKGGGLGSAVARDDERVPASDGEHGADLTAHRELQQQVRRVLDDAFRKLLMSRPHLWSKQAYWVLAGAIYERIVVQGGQIPTGELVSLAKMLMENRRLELLEKAGAKQGKPRNPKLSEDEVLGEAVRRVYGVETSKRPNGGKA